MLLPQDNMNPLEGLERSALALAATVHRRPPAALVRPQHAARLAAGAGAGAA